MEAGVIGQHLLCSALLQAEGRPRRRLQEHEQVVKDVVLPGTLTFIDTDHPNGWVQPWLEVTPGKSLAGTEELVYQTLHQFACFSHVWYCPVDAIGQKFAQIACVIRVIVVFFYLFLLLVLTYGAVLLAAAFQLMTPFSGPPAEEAPAPKRKAQNHHCWKAAGLSQPPHSAPGSALYPATAELSSISVTLNTAA